MNRVATSSSSDAIKIEFSGEHQGKVTPFRKRRLLWLCISKVLRVRTLTNAAFNLTEATVGLCSTK